MSLYKPKSLDIHQIQVTNQRLGFTLGAIKSNQLSQKSISFNLAPLLTLLEEEKVQNVLIKPVSRQESTFICKINKEIIELITQSSIKKTTYCLNLETSTLTVNTIKADTSILKHFISRIEKISKLVLAKKAIAYGH